MGRYSKFNSKYILQQRRQVVKEGTVWERDFGTLGERHRLDPGKKVYYTDGNFIFTDSDGHRRETMRSLAPWTAHLTSDDIIDPIETHEDVTVSPLTDDIRDYAYYGSCVELIQSSVENILLTFPGNITVTESTFIIYDQEGNSRDTGLYIIDNPFMIDLYHQSGEVPSDANPMRYMSSSYSRYAIHTYNASGDEVSVSPIIGYALEDPVKDFVNNEIHETYGYEYVKYYDRLFRWSDALDSYEEVYVNDCDDYFLKCGEYIRYRDKYYAWSEIGQTYTELSVYVVCDDNYREFRHITLTTQDNNVYHIYGYWVDGNTIFATSNPNYTIEPTHDIIDDYFKTLDGFEALLLRRDTAPYYSNRFWTPVTNDDGFYSVIRRRYTWPSNGDFIIVGGPSYTNFINNLYTLGESIDTLWSDNLWGRMTHESIKNFDAAYRYDTPSNVDEYSNGSRRMERTMHFLGRLFDNGRRYILGVGRSSTVTYDAMGNVCDAELTDRNRTRGWDGDTVTDTIYYYEEIEHTETDDTHTFVELDRLPAYPSTLSPAYVAVGCVDGTDTTYYALRHLSPEDARLTYDYLDGFYSATSTTDTWVSKDNPWITSNATGYAYVKIPGIPSKMATTDYNYATTFVDIPSNYWTTTTELNVVPYYVTSSSPLLIRRVSGTSTTYWGRVHGFDPDAYLHGTWYGGRNAEVVSMLSTDRDWQRRLFISTKRIFATKGTREGIDMVMGLFGFGRDDAYSLTERYRTTEPKDYDAPFYYYIPTDSTPASYSVVTEIPTDADASSPTAIAIDNGYGVYNYYILTHSNTYYDFLEELAYHKTLKLEYNTVLSGVPLEEVWYGNNHYIVPFYYQDRVYDGDLYFQQKGGWGKESTDNNIKHDYTETVPYLHILKNVKDLTSIVTEDIEDCNIVYVMSLSDYSEHYGSIPTDLSHFFICGKTYMPDEYSSWEYIPMDGPITHSNYQPTSQYVTHDAYLRAIYLKSIVYNVLGNNPHVGYGAYDCGEDYMEYMSRPYRSSVENMEYDDERYQVMASQVHYGITSLDAPNDDDKIKTVGHFIRYDNSGTYSATIVDRDSAGETQYLNDKVLIMHNAINSDLYRTYFHNVILPYVLQVIPSTTILILDNFACTENRKTTFYTLTLHSCGIGDVYGAGTYGTGDTAHLRADASDGYHFVRWVIGDTCDGVTLSTDSSITVTVCGDAVYTAVFEKNIELSAGCDTGRCAVNFECEYIANCKVDFECETVKDCVTEFLCDIVEE